MPIKKNRKHPFGDKRFTISAKARYSSGNPHWAYDYATPMGTPLFAPRDGKITLVRDGEPDGLGPKPGRPGNVVVLTWTTKKGEKRALMFNHLQKGSVRVKSGQKVKAGARLASTGNSGNSTGPHIHIAGLRYWPTWGDLYAYMHHKSMRLYPPNRVWRRPK